MHSPVYVLAQAIKHASTQYLCKSHLVCKPHPDFQGERLVQNFATYMQINTMFTKEAHETG